MGDPEPSLRNTRTGATTRHGTTHNMHTCTSCNATKPDSEFYKKDRSGRRDTTCKACRIEKLREKKLGITGDEYKSLYKKQRGRCGICERRLYSKRYNAFCVDHEHSTGKIRGLLCHNCNGAIGMLRDCPTTIRRAAKWVEGIV